MQKKHHIKTGDIFITNENCQVKVIQYVDRKNVLIEFQDKHKHQTYVQVGHLVRGAVRNPYKPSVCGIGFTGVGRYAPKVNGKRTQVYSVWHSMFNRCYNPNQFEKNPTYQDCEVCEAWHNFQVFAEWYESQPFSNLDYEIEKDLLIEGNRVYSPTTCLLAPKAINSLFRGHKRIDENMPMGVYQKEHGFQSLIRMNGILVNLGFFNNAQDASNAYQKAKKEYVKQKALEWQNRIDERLFDALMAKAA